METLLGCIIFIILLYIAFQIFTIPIRIAEGKGLTRNEMRPIRILNWCALLAGITWFIALYLAITAESRPLRRR